eukprot:3785148-Alexandrium_andersonii.AAC.1
MVGKALAFVGFQPGRRPLGPCGMLLPRPPRAGFKQRASFAEGVASMETFRPRKALSHRSPGEKH